jgi:hypothetical protein
VSLAGSNAISDAFDRCRHIQKANGSIFGQPLQRCFGAGNPTADQTIEGCATVIAAGLWTGKDAAIPLQQRVNAYEKKGDYEHVIADTTETLQLYPDAAVIRATRGRAHVFQADFSAAAADLSRSVALKDDPYTTIWRFLARRRAGPEGRASLPPAPGNSRARTGRILSSTSISGGARPTRCRPRRPSPRRNARRRSISPNGIS